MADTTHVNAFVAGINEAMRCKTPNCDGRLILTSFRVKGLGGAIDIVYKCSKCASHPVEFSSNCAIEDGTRSEVAVGLQVAFILSGGMHSTYSHVLSHGLGIEAFGNHTFYSLLEEMYGTVKAMLDEMCEEAKSDMKQMNPSTLGSWKRAVTTADGAWMTRGYHSSNATFSIRNYQNGALLYYTHICQRGRDNIIQTPLYRGTSKSAEGYGARQLYSLAKKEGMDVAVQWQDGDSSSANVISNLFPEAEVMICSGHAAKSHKKVLEGYSKIKAFSDSFIKTHQNKHPTVKEVKCKCSGRHGQGCGCLTPAFIERARNNFSTLLTDSNSPEEFQLKVRALSRHAGDEHEWKEGKCEGKCDFHELLVCSCGKCENPKKLECKGKEYHTRLALTCPLHQLGYAIELESRASKARKYIHKTMKRGHSNWLEASHNIFIRFRSKMLNLERLHYEVATNLALLQSNLTYLTTKKGNEYHWIPELYKRMKLPVYDGLDNKYHLYLAYLVPCEVGLGITSHEINFHEINSREINSILAKSTSN